MGKFTKAISICMVIVIVGVIISGGFFALATMKAQSLEAYLHTYSYVNPISGETKRVSGDEIRDMTLFEFIGSEYMNNTIWILTGVIFAAFLVLAIVFYAMHSKQELSITGVGITGKALWGKAVNVDFSRIEQVKKAALKGVLVTTIGQEKIKFHLLKNQNEVIEQINLRIGSITKQSGSNMQEGSSTDQLKAYKELLDNGTITQEEFDAKKKQLLGL